MNDVNIEDKAKILYKNGFLRYEDTRNIKRILDRWVIYQNVPQKTPRGVKAGSKGPE